MRLRDKVVVITGAARGQGEIEARAVVEEGAIAILCDVRHDLGREAANRLCAEGGRAEYHPLDVTSGDDWHRVCTHVVDEHGRIDALVNNAGVGHRVPLLQTSRTAWNSLMAVNVTGPALGIQAVAPHMTRTGGGAVVNISSVAGLTAWPAVAYSVSKWAVRGLTKGAALELGEAGIRVNSLHPGVVATEFMADAPEEFRHAYRDVVPLGREADADEIAPLVIFLCSDESRYVTGAEIAVDGGFSAAGAGHAMSARMRLESGTNSMLRGHSSAEQLDQLRATTAEVTP